MRGRTFRVLFPAFLVLCFAGTLHGFELEAARTFPSGERPFSLARGDFNADGIEDLAAADHDAGDVSIFLGNGSGGIGDGTFAPAYTYPTADGPRYILTADFNEDGILDLAVTHTYVNRVAVLIGLGSAGSGNGTFAPAVLYDVRAGSTWMAAGDFNADDILDLAVANLWGSHVSILLGNGSAGIGDGTFQEHVDYPAGESPNCVTVEDFDSDGILDLAVADMAGDAVLIFLGGGSGGQGDGTFALSAAYPTGSGTACVIAEDLDGDGILDLAASNYFDDSVSILMGNGSGGQGDGTFAARVDYPAGHGPPALTSGDFDGDTELDLAVVNYHADAASILFGTGDGRFGSPVAYAVGDGPELLRVGDYNEDGVLDLASANALSDNVSILLGRTGDERGTFRSAPRYGAGLGPIDVETADFNEDGFPDIAVADSTTDRIQILIADGTGRGFLPAVGYGAGASPVALAWGDFDGDGILDLAAADFFGDCILILEGNGAGGVGDGTFGTPYAVPAGNGPRSIRAADFNEDGALDLAAADDPGREAAVLLGNGDGTFGPPAPYPLGSRTRDLAVGDFNADGILDLVAACTESGTVAVLLGNGTAGVGDGTFAAAVHLAAGTSPVAVVSGFFDGDDHEDLAVACDLADSLVIFPGNGDGTFGAPLRADALGMPRGLCAVDMDGDGRSDLASVNRSACNLSLRMSGSSAGGPEFLPREDFGVGESPAAVIACDLNRDGLPDLVTADEARGTVSVLLNASGNPAAVADLGAPAGPASLCLHPYPNPLAADTRIAFTAERGGLSRVSVFDVQGRLVRVLAEGRIESGTHEVLWDGLDGNGRAVSPGVYLCRVETPCGVRVGKVVVIR